MVKAIIFDFDGVLVESIGVKKDAFRMLFLDYPDQVDAIVDYHMEQGGLSRYLKFDYIYKNILKEPLTKERSEQLGARFTQLSHKNVITAAFVPGAKEFLEKYSQKLDLFVASGTPHEEMLRVVDEMSLGKYFKKVYGSPATKKEIAENILSDLNLEPKEVLFVGDAINDYHGAQPLGIPFVGRIHASYESPFKGLDIDYLIDDIFQLEQIIQDY